MKSAKKRVSSMKRWKCPLCSSGKLAPSKPRKNDVRRYCLPCSEKTGRLVERFCPALEKQRKAAAEEKTRRAEMAKQAKKNRADRHWLVHGVDMRDVWDKMRNLKSIKKHLRGRSVKIGAAQDHLTIRRSKIKGYTTGCAYGGSLRVVVTAGTLSCPGLFQATLLHEICHLAAYFGNRDHKWTPKREWGGHGHHFNKILTEAASELWGICLEGSMYGYARTWSLDKAICDQFNTEYPGYLKDHLNKPTQES